MSVSVTRETSDVAFTSWNELIDEGRAHRHQCLGQFDAQQDGGALEPKGVASFFLATVQACRPP